MPVESARKERILDECIDRLLINEQWSDLLPDDATMRREVSGLMTVAQRVAALARVTRPAPEAVRRKTWRRVFRASNESLVRKVALYRLPYLPPLWIPREAC